MRVSVNNLLDAGLLVHGKFPDIYWELDLTGTEIKVLRYVYNNCLRLYKNLKFFPKGKDGSPRFWRGKERMADDCKLSYPTFRKNVRHLFELGLVTSMDSETESENLYCIGLSSEFLNTFAANHTVKNFRLHNLKDLISIIYDNTTLEIIENIKDLDKFPLITNVIKLTETQGFVNSTNDSKPTTQNKPKTLTKFKRTPIRVKRKPIHIERKPIFILPESLRLQSAQQKLKMLQNVRTPYERKILQVAEYYEYKCRQAIKSTGFRALGKDFRNHKNWIYLQRIWNLCNENGWDYKIYIDAQFDRVKYWDRKQLYPYLNQFNSQNAIKYFKNYVQDYKDKNMLSSDSKIKSEKVKSINNQIIDDVIKDCEGISEYIEKAQKRRANKGLTREQLKILYLSDHWMSLSTYYLSSIPWFLTYLEQFPEETFLCDLKREITTIRNSNRIYNLTMEIVSNVEKQMYIPETLCL